MSPASTAVTIDDFLGDAEANEIRWARPSGAPLAIAPDRVLIADGPDALEVAVASAPAKPRVDDVRKLWSARWGRRAAPVVLIVGYQDNGAWKAAVCGTKDDPAVITDLDLSQVERICAAALAAPDSVNAERTLHRLLVGQKDQLVAGLINSGLFASHELRTGVPARADWHEARNNAAALLRLRGIELIRALGYTTSPHGSTALILAAGQAKQAVAVLLDEQEMFDRPNARFGVVSPVTQGQSIAQEHGLDWLLVTRGTQMRLYPAKPDVGVGRKGQTETYVEVDLALLAEEQAAYLNLLFSANALAAGGTVAEILHASAYHAAALGKRLRERVYDEVVPHLATVLAGHTNASTEAELAEAYHRTLIILFRLLFVSYAEDRGLLPYQRNPRYTKKALKTIARELADKPDAEFDEFATDRWDDLLAVWRAVDDGNSEWGVPAYNGGLFAADDGHPSGKAIARMRLTNAEIGPALRSLLVDTGEDGTFGPVDFRSLSVREFGTIYEGLLESSLSVAPTALTIDRKTGTYLPAKARDEVAVPAGNVYFHNASGARKSTGSYFTKSFAVEHLLRTALEPALVRHLDGIAELLATGDDATAADRFFDFRVADLAMGSGHFLVAAIDRIETRFSAFLAQHPISAITEELNRLGEAARNSLGTNALDVEIEPSALLRRQIARRCIYGLDVNLIAVELARLGIWIHTFVPGLPMSALDHGLVVGNSLTGIGTVDEVLGVFEPQRTPGQYSIFVEEIEAALQSARDRLLRVARTAEATKQEVREAARAHAKAMEDAADAKALLDAAVGVRLGVIPLPSGPEQAITAGRSATVQAKVAELRATHMPYLFPEVFLRDNPGFDVLLGNPPWEKLQVEEHSLYSLHYPGLRGLNQTSAEEEIVRIRRQRPDLVAEYEKATAVMQEIKTALARGPYPGLTAGRPDLYKAFAWRMWHVVRANGNIGVVLPRKALEASGMKDWRTALLRDGTFTDVTVLTNNGGWVFDDVHGQYTVGLVAITADRTNDPDKTIVVRGPYASHQAFDAGVSQTSRPLPVADLLSWSDNAALPLLPDDRSLKIFLALRSHPRLDTIGDGLEVRGLRELNATDDKDEFIFGSGRNGLLPVYKGDSFDLWNPATGSVYAWADPRHIEQVLQKRRNNQIRTRRSAFYGQPAEWTRDPQTLPFHHPRVAWRDSTNRTNTRTLITALVPPDTVMVHQAYYLFLRQGTRADEAYLLGVLSSIPFDWYARQMVESHATVEFLLGSPVPRPDRNDPLLKRVVEIAGRLGAVDGRYADWAAKVGVSVGSATDEATKNDLIAELDAVVALLYGLGRDDVCHMFATFHRGWNYQPRLDAVLTHYDSWKVQAAQ